MWFVYLLGFVPHPNLQNYNVPNVRGGEYKGKEGNFEFIKEADGNINHRFFKPN
jgi:hypothetical protein